MVYVKFPLVQVGDKFWYNGWVFVKTGPEEGQYLGETRQNGPFLMVEGGKIEFTPDDRVEIETAIDRGPR